MERIRDQKDTYNVCDYNTLSEFKHKWMHFRLPKFSICFTVFYLFCQFPQLRQWLALHVQNEAKQNTNFTFNKF